MYHENWKCWVITKIQDDGLIALLNTSGVEDYSRNKDGVTSYYWKIPDEIFLSVKDLLLALGYTEYCPNKTPSEQNTAAFKVTSSSSAPSVKTGNDRKIYSVLELCNLLSNAINHAFPLPIWVEGVIIECTKAKGNLYVKIIDKAFEQNDKKNLAKLTIFQNVYEHAIAPKLAQEKLSLRVNLKIRVWGMVSFYSGDGSVSLVVKDIDTQFSTVDLAIRRKLIQDKLFEMGIHDNNKNLPMPILPLKLAVFSKLRTDGESFSESGATKIDSASGCGDFINKLQNSGFPFEVTIFNVALQGNFLEESFMQAFKKLDEIGPEYFDVAVIARGGGSTSDLCSFDSLPIATYIAKSPLKFLIGIGHDKDWTVLDYIAQREITPTAVADVLVERVRNFAQSLDNAKNDLIHITTKWYDNNNAQIIRLREQCESASVQYTLHVHNYLSGLKHDIEIASQNLINQKQNILSACRDQVQFQSLATTRLKENNLNLYKQTLKSESDRIEANNRSFLNLKSLEIEHLCKNITANAHNQLNNIISDFVQCTQNLHSAQQQKLDDFNNKIKLLDPSDVFGRGFASVSTLDKKRISSVKDLSIDQKIIVRLIDGSIEATVSNIHENQHSTNLKSDKG